MSSTDAPISIRLDKAVRETLARDASEHRIGLATYLRDLATARARALRKEEIRAQSRRAASAIAEDPTVREFVERWTAPSAWGERE